MPPLNDAVTCTPSTVQTSTLSSPTEPSVSSKPVADVLDADSDCKHKSDGTRHSLEKATNLIIDVKTLTKLCDLEGADAVQIGDTLTKGYNDMCGQQAHRTTAHNKMHNLLLATLDQECTLDENVAAHYDRFVCKMEEAETAMCEQHKQLMMMDATMSIKLARANSQLARDLRKKTKSLESRLRATERKMMAAKDRLVDLLVSAVVCCLEADTVAVKVEREEGN